MRWRGGNGRVPAPVQGDGDEGVRASSRWRLAGQGSRDAAARRRPRSPARSCCRAPAASAPPPSLPPSVSRGGRGGRGGYCLAAQGRSSSSWAAAAARGGWPYPSRPPTHLLTPPRPLAVMLRSAGKDIVKRSGARRGRFLLVLNCQVAPAAAARMVSGGGRSRAACARACVGACVRACVRACCTWSRVWRGRLSGGALMSPPTHAHAQGTLSRLDTRTPVLYLDFPNGRLKLKGGWSGRAGGVGGVVGRAGVWVGGRVGGWGAGPAHPPRHTQRPPPHTPSHPCVDRHPGLPPLQVPCAEAGCQGGAV